MKRKSIVKVIIFVILIVSTLLLNQHFGWSEYLSDGKNLLFLKRTVNDNLFLAVLIYIGVTVIGCVVFALPGVTFAVLAGILFGPVLGIFVCLQATTLGAMLAFIVGRFFLKDGVKPLVEQNKLLKKLLFSNNDKSETLVLIITRMVPIFPYNLQNFAYGITDISFWKYSVLTFIFMFPGVSFFTIGAAGITATGDRWKYFIVAGILAIAVTLLGIWIKKCFLDDNESRDY